VIRTGKGHAGRKQARRKDGTMSTDMISLVIVPLLVWIGVFGYLLMVDRKLARLEAETVEGDL
jgi:CcmD family protein